MRASIKSLLTFLCLFLSTLSGISAHPYFIKAVGTPAEEASSVSRLRNARAVETEGRQLREVGNKPPEAAHPVPKLQAGGTAPKLRAAEITAPKPKVAEKALRETPGKEISLSRSKKMDAPGQGVTTPNATAQQNALKLPYRFKPQQYFDSPQRAVQPTTAPKARVRANPDYSTPEAAYSLRIDPHAGKGPMAIDSHLFTSGEKTLHGGIRNKLQFWNHWKTKYPGTLSARNTARIEEGIAPVVDSHWIQHFPEHQNYMKQTLEHHHLDQGRLAVPLPKTLHRGAEGNYGIWHNLKEKK